MTRMKPSVQINNSISPIDNKVASADATEEREDKEKEAEEERREEEDGQEGPEDKGEAAEDFEVRVHKIGRRPMAPTKAEIEAHFPLHLNYRSWCKHCVAGKARLDQHRLDDPNRERLGITWSADYAFMGSEEAEEGMQPTLVMYDDDKESFWAIGVQQKGPTEPLVRYCVEALDQSGYRGQKITF